MRRELMFRFHAPDGNENVLQMPGIQSDQSRVSWGFLHVLLIMLPQIHRPRLSAELRELRARRHRQARAGNLAIQVDARGIPVMRKCSINTKAFDHMTKLHVFDEQVQLQCAPSGAVSAWTAGHPPMCQPMHRPARCAICVNYYLCNITTTSVICCFDFNFNTP
jgi:hypothetical protein